MVDTPSVTAVELGYHGNPVQTGDLSSEGQDPPFDQYDETALGEAEMAIKEAVSQFNSVWSDQILYTSEVEDEYNAVKLLARHRWAIILGEAQSESQAGANVTWNVPSELARSLGRTRYGQEFLELAENEPNVSVFRTR